MSAPKTVSPAEAVALMRKGAVLIDIREAHEHAAENIPGARHHALSQIDARHPLYEGDTVLIYHCKSGARTNMNAKRLAAASGACQVYLLGGGIAAWKRAGLPTSDTGSNKPVRAGRAQGGLLNRLAGMFR
jgi:rhodanese-related sulfurtransferase